MASGKILGGLAILEDANHNTAQVTAVPVEQMEQREEELLRLVKSWMGRIPMDLDVLILDEIGKNISGAGMDTKVVNRSLNGEYNPWPDAPRIERIFVRGLSDLSYGNGVGLGMADVVSDRLLAKIDWNPTRINSLTASTPAAIRTPVHFPTRSRMYRADRAHRGQARSQRGDVRLAPELAGTRDPRAEREPAPADREESDPGNSRPGAAHGVRRRGNLVDLLVPAGEVLAH